MASYEELHSIVNDGSLRHKIQVAIADVAYDIFQEGTPVAERVAWAHEAMDSPVSVEKKLMNYVLIANKGADVSVILAAADANFKNNIADAVTKTVAAEA